MCRYEFAVTINNLSRRTMSNAREVVWSGSEQKNRTTYMNRTATLWHAPSRMRPRAKIIEGAFEHYRRHARAFFRGRLRVVRFVIDRRRRRFADLCVGQMHSQHKICLLNIFIYLVAIVEPITLRPINQS